ncbi:MAG: beta-lactamase family protein [Gemmatimonadaceae bacterium]|nr:beta-lactamase family protein [Gemmatimonadaceae bacterium]
MFCATVVSAQSSTSIRRLDGRTVSHSTADSLARALVASHRVTGMQVAVVNDGRITWSAAYGLRQKNPDLPMERQSITWAASITKAAFATWVMQLSEQGAVKLDQPIVTMLKQPLSSYDEWADRSRLLMKDPRWARVTPRMLLSLTSGLGNFAMFEPDTQMHIHHDPGTAFRYSGEGLNVLQLALEERFGMPLAALMDSALFRPLTMRNTAVAFRSEFEPNMADRFGTNEQFLAKTRRNARAAGSMTTNAEDLAHFGIALMDGRVLGKATMAEMLRPQIVLRSAHQFPLAGDPPTSEETKRVGLAYGLGWGLLTRTPYGPAFFKEGNGDGARTYMICFPKRRDCMVILTNSDNGAWVFRPLMEAVFGNTVTPWEWEGYTATYLAKERGGT